MLNKLLCLRNKEIQLNKALTIIMSLILGGCSTLDIKKIPDSSNVLVLTISNNEFNIVHDGYHIIPRFRPQSIYEANPSWKLSELFDDYVLSFNDSSRFNLISGKSENLPRPKNYWNYSGLEKELLSLSEKYSADYILLLSSHPVWNTSMVIYLESEYGYMHEVRKPWFNYEVNSGVYLNANISLFNPQAFKKDLDESVYCNSFATGVLKGYEVEAADLPNELPDNFKVTDIKEEVISKIHVSAENKFKEVFNLALQECGVIEKVETKKRNTRHKF